MKIRPSVIIPAILLAVLLILLLAGRHHSKSGFQSQGQESATTNLNAPQTTSERQPPVVTDKPVVLPNTNSRASAQNIPRGQQEQLRQAVENMNSPIHFYGKTVDQNGGPISEVKIQVKVRQWYADSPTTSNFGAKTIPIEKTTRADGRFEIQDVDGDAFDLESVTKDGYKLSPSTPHSFGATGGSPENPVIIKMWKEGTKESLIGGNHLFGMNSDQIYTLDLLKGSKIQGESEGDLRFLISRPPDVKSKDKFPWSFSIEGIGGGLVETDDEFMYLAPEAGYQSKFQVQLNTTDSNWTSLAKRNFFIRSRDGQVFGWIRIKVYAIYNLHSAVEISYAVNPSGSRNLQP